MILISRSVIKMTDLKSLKLFKSKKPSSIQSPLHTIFERHLLHSVDSLSEQTSFVQRVLEDYVSYLHHKNIFIPKSLEPSILKELSSQIQTMLLKKTYGFLSLGEFQKDTSRAEKKQVQARYARLKKN